MSLPFSTLVKFWCLHFLTLYLMDLGTLLVLWVPRTTVRFLSDHWGILAGGVVWQNDWVKLRRSSELTLSHSVQQSAQSLHWWGTLHSYAHYFLEPRSCKACPCLEHLCHLWLHFQVLYRRDRVTMMKHFYTVILDSNFKLTVGSKAQEQVESQKTEKRMHGAIAGWTSWVLSHQVYIPGCVRSAHLWFYSKHLCFLRGSAKPPWLKRMSQQLTISHDAVPSFTS